jgi:hypothetical protein
LISGEHYKPQLSAGNTIVWAERGFRTVKGEKTSLKLKPAERSHNRYFTSTGIFAKMPKFSPPVNPVSSVASHLGRK